MARISRLQQQIGESESEIVDIQNSYQQEVIGQWHDLNNRVSDLSEQLRAAREILRQNAVIAEQVASNLSGQEPDTVTVIRKSEDGLQVLAVAENSLIFSGDMIRIPGFTSALFPSESDVLQTAD
jgi:hypothetical protein